ncbi:hypothetical protein [Sphingopyxis sp. BSNA05]|uniref:hypothetical protein n=1 Tax=Sphingopyxis sp. BSNA05 TaxID=1236614 RepID=UPI00349F65E8
MTKNRKFTLVSRPVGEPKESDFALVEEDLPELSDGSFLVRNHYISLDPAQRGWMSDAESYMPPIALGAAVTASSVGRVAESKTRIFQSDNGLSVLARWRNIRWWKPAVSHRQSMPRWFRLRPIFCRYSVRSG